MTFIKPYKANVEKTMSALKSNNINAIYFEKGKDALNWVKDAIPEGSKIAIGGSNTLRDIGMQDAFERLTCIICEAPMHTQRDIKTPCVKTGHCTDCKSPDRPCSIYSIIRFQNRSNGAGRITVLIVNEDLGF